MWRLLVNVDCVVGPVYECVSECDGVQVCIVCQCELLCVNCMKDWDQTCTKTSNTDKMYLKRDKKWHSSVYEYLILVHRQAILLKYT